MYKHEYIFIINKHTVLYQNLLSSPCRCPISFSLDFLEKYLDFLCFSFIQIYRGMPISVPYLCCHTDGDVNENDGIFKSTLPPARKILPLSSVDAVRTFISLLKLEGSNPPALRVLQLL